MLARRPVVIRFDDLKELLGLPEEVEIYDVKSENGELEFTIVSKEAIEGLTVKAGQGYGLIRRISVNGIKQWNEKQNEEQKEKEIPNYVSINVEVNEKPDDVKNLAKEILKGLDRIEKSRGK